MLAGRGYTIAQFRWPEGRTFLEQLAAVPNPDVQAAAAILKEKVGDPERYRAGGPPEWRPLRPAKPQPAPTRTS